MTEKTFKRGQRVQYSGPVPSWNGKTGTVTGRDASGWLRVRFDDQQSYEKGIQCSDSNLTLYDKERLEYVAHYDAMAKAARELGYHAQMTINALERDNPALLERDDATGDEARAALVNAKAWKARLETQD